MTTNTFNFKILGRNASLTVDYRDRNLRIEWDRLVVCEFFGEIGFWAAFHQTSGTHQHGAAHDAALLKFAREWAENQIYESLDSAQELMREARDAE